MPSGDEEQFLCLSSFDLILDHEGEEGESGRAHPSVPEYEPELQGLSKPAKLQFS